jgi:formamidopyrimidine-DNA glycosylase
MPELPEVHGYEKYIAQTCFDKKIISLSCRDERLLKKPLQDFKDKLIGNSITSSKRIGKYLFLILEDNQILLMHFGMTGRPNYYFGEEARPKFGHIVIGFENGYYFAFENKRKFGRWDLVEDIAAYQKEHKLGKDARDLTFDEFYDSIKNKKIAVKKILMDQSICAGIGNWMADDILYQAQIHPEQKTNTIYKEGFQKVFDKMQYVIETAIELEAHYIDFPNHFLIHRRVKEADCFYSSGKIDKIVVGGRATYYSPVWQKLVDG